MLRRGLSFAAPNNESQQQTQTSDTSSTATAAASGPAASNNQSGGSPLPRGGGSTKSVKALSSIRSDSTDGQSPDLDISQLQSLLAFSPNILLTNITGDSRGPLTEPKSFTFNGAALLSDISGFSKFAGAQCARGVLGLSDLHETTNGFLGHFVSTVYRYGGDVIAFAGDALICLFVNDPFGANNERNQDGFTCLKIDNDPYLAMDCHIRALECAMELRAFCTSSLSTHIAVTSGEMKLAILGGRNNEWIYLLNGKPVAQLECLTDARSKQVVCTPRCLESAKVALSDMGLTIESHLTTHQCASGNYLLDYLYTGVHPSKDSHRVNRLTNANSEHAIKLTKQFVPKPVLFAIESGSLDRIAELRQVVTMFVSLDSYSPEVHMDPLTLQPFFALVQESLQHTGGYMRQFVIDDKGCVAIGMWGVPQFSYTNNACRGLYAAANIRNKALENLNLKCSVGLTTGYVFCGGVGANMRKDYVVMGADVNMAARFMCKANGRVLVDQATKKSLPVDLQNALVVAEEMNLKGALIAIRPYEFPGTNLSSITISESQEKDIETASLRKSVRNIISKHLEKIFPDTRRGKLLSTITMDSAFESHFTVILGKEGSGKTAAVQYYMDHAGKHNAEYYTIQCKSGDESQPYSCIKDWFILIVGPESFKTQSSQARMIKELIVDAFPAADEISKKKYQRQLEHILGVDSGIVHEDAESRDLRMELMDAKLYAAKSFSHTSRKKLGLESSDLVLFEVLNFLIKKRNVAVSIEDAHHCDTYSWKFLETLISGKCKISVLITMTPPDMSSLSVSRGNSVSTGSNTSQSGRNNDDKDKDKDEGSSSKKMGDSKLVRVTKASGGERSMGFADEVALYNVTSPDVMFNILIHDHCTVVELDPLSSAEVNDLLSLALGSKRIDPEYVDSVLEVTNGNAYWCNIIVDFIKDCGVEEFTQTFLKRGSGHNSLKELILKRIDKLAPEQAIIAKYAAIIGDNFSFSIVRDLMPTQLQSSVASHLEVLRQNGIINSIGGPKEDLMFAFQNQLIRNTIYDLTPPSDCAKAHSLIAEMIVKKYHRDLRAHFEKLSYHYRSAGAAYRSLALKFTLRAADEYFSNNTYPQGIQFLDIASKIAQSSTEFRVVLDMVEVVLNELRPQGIGMSLVGHFHDNNHKLKVDLQNIKTNIMRNYHESGGRKGGSGSSSSSSLGSGSNSLTSSAVNSSTTLWSKSNGSMASVNEGDDDNNSDTKGSGKYGSKGSDTEEGPAKSSTCVIA